MWAAVAAAAQRAARAVQGGGAILTASRRLRERGFFVRAIRPPTVPRRRIVKHFVEPTPLRTSSTR